MNFPLRQFFSLLVLGTLLSPPVAFAQISVTAQPVTNAFATQPPSSQWSTHSVGGTSGTIGSTAVLDSTAQALSASSITTGTTLDNSGGTPAQASLAVWSTSGYLQTRASGNAATILMATLRNSSSGTSGVLNVRYDFAALSPMTEEAPGLRAFYSFTGASGSWQNIATFSSAVAGAKSMTLNITSWPTNALLYLMWADDNGGPVDTAFQIDNFMAQFISGPPVIGQQPENTIVAPGETALFQVSAYGSEPLSYEWRKGEVPIPNATNFLLSISNTQPADAGNYAVVISNAFGVITSTVATLSVGIAPLAITTEPQDTSAIVGSSAFVNVAVNGSGQRFQWFKGNSPIPNATNATLTFSPAQLSDTALYRVVATNTFNAVTSRAAIVSIVPPPYHVFGLTNHFWRYNQDGVDLGSAWREIQYSAEAHWPTGRGVFAFEDLASVRPLTNTVLRLDNPPGTRIITYYFRTEFLLTNESADVMLVTSNLIDDGVVLYANGNEAYRMNMPAGSIGYSTLASGALTEGVFLTNTVPGHFLRTGTNVLAVEVHQNSASSSDIVKGISARIHYVPTTLLGITNQPLSQTVDELRPVTFTIGYTGLTARVQWFRNTGVGPEAVPGANQTTLTLASPIQGVDDGIYFAVISNAVDFVMSAPATLVITQAAPTIISQPQNQQLCPGDTLELEVAAHGSAVFTFQWLRNGEPLAGATNQSFIIASSSISDTAHYSVVVSNSVGAAVSSNATVEVRLAPFVVTQPKGIGAVIGSGAQFNVVPAGCPPFTYQWQFHGTNLANATNATLTIPNVQLSDEGPYRVMISNPHDSIASVEVPLIASIGQALNAPELPWTVAEGAWQVEPAETHDGIASVRSVYTFGAEPRLETTVSGPGRISFWTHTIGPSPFLRFRIDGRSEAQWLASAPWWKSEFYVPTGVHVLSWELFSGSSAIVYLDEVTFSTNDLGPVILSPVADLTVAAGSNVALLVSADGFPPLSFQWQFNGTNIPAATQSIFSQLNAQSQDAGSYTVVVSNQFGIATSTGSLSVIGSPPRVEPQMRVLAVRDRAVHLNAQASGSEPMTFQWRHDGAPIFEATNASLVLPPGTNWPGHYSVAVTNAFGGAVSSNISILLTQVVRVVQISMDGLAAQHLINGLTKDPARYPFFRRLMREGAFTFNARCDVTHSITVPNHISMVTGRPVLQPPGEPATVHHGYTNNSTVGNSLHFEGNTNVDYFASAFDVVHDRGGATAFVSTKSSLQIIPISYGAGTGAPDLIPPDNGRAKIDFQFLSSSSVSAVTALLPRLGAKTDTYSFLHFTETDSAGHGSGWGSPQWFVALEQLDVQLGRVMSAAMTDAGFVSDTVVIVTADHGGEGESHLDPAAPLAYTIPMFVWGPGFSGGTDLYRLFANRADPRGTRVEYTTVWTPLWNGDVGNLALAVLGLPPIPSSTLIPMFPTDTVTLAASQAGGDVIVEWPASAVGFTLESTTALGAGWTPVTSGITTNVNGFRYIVPITAGERFFQLRK